MEFIDWLKVPLASQERFCYMEIVVLVKQGVKM
jgi:hypothetical protein